LLVTETEILKHPVCAAHYLVKPEL